MTFHYVWLVWSSAFLLPWVLLYRIFPQHRVVMWRASLFMLPFGLTEPFFVPEYWNPPSLFELAQKTGFDIESLIFSFAIGGIAAVLYNIIMHKRLQVFSVTKRQHKMHRWHRMAIVLPFALFPILYFLPWNPIHAGIAALLAMLILRPGSSSVIPTQTTRSPAGMT